MLSTKVTLGCNHKNCKTTFEANTRRLAKVGARKLGWKVKGTKVHYCPTHRQENGYPTVAQRKAERVAKKAEKVSATKKATKPVTTTKKVTKSTVRKPIAQPMTVGQAVPGMVAKSAKQASAKR